MDHIRYEGDLIRNCRYRSLEKQREGVAKTK